MKIINLIENTIGRSGCICAHGLSFYIETADHKLLVDLGPSSDTLKNADTLGVDLTAVDTVILSHGHYDHANGIVPFAEINDHADIYMQKSASGEYYSEDEKEEGSYRYIGIDSRIPELGQIKLIEGDHVIDDELEIFTVKNKKREIPFTNNNLLVKTSDGYVQDDFSHENYLVIKDGDRRILISGCAHMGILNILDTFHDRYDCYPDVVISGFHVNRSAYTMDELDAIGAIAQELNNYPTEFITCHCTGEVGFDLMHNFMGDKLKYIHCGESLEL